MKLRCVDGKVRDFNTVKTNEVSYRLQEATCMECGEGFGVHDTWILKPLFKAHVCKKEKSPERRRAPDFPPKVETSQSRL